MASSFERIAIVNRGEAAMRAIRAIQELRREEGSALQAIALYTDPDRGALFVREADEAVALGSASFVDARDGRRKNRYLDYATLERALMQSCAEAAWVGWGFVAEHAEFAELCRRLGVVFIGPDPEVMRSLGDKIGSKRMAEAAGVPVAPWSGGPVESLAEARAQAERLGFPLMVKATAGGGGRGIRRVHGAEELAEAFEGARSEALAGFGDATVFIEQLVEGARHVEVQILGDGQGTTWALGVRDCTVQRRNQKVIEESPSPALTARQQHELCEAAARLGDRACYRGAGTVEFLYEPALRRFSFMEVNARLQVEHPVTELTTGADLVKLQLHVARGGRLAGGPPAPRGHAIEVRINAEDPERGFAPAPGRIELMRLPTGPGIRVDTGFREGDRVAPEFDSMLAKLIVVGRDRGEALARLERALHEMQIALRGGASNKGFLLALLARPEVRSGEVDVGWLDRLAAEGGHLTRRHADVALVAGAIEAYDAESARERARFYATAARGRFQLPGESGCEVEIRQRAARHALRVFRVGARSYRVEGDGALVEVEVERLGPFERRLRIAGRSHHVLSLTAGVETVVEVDGTPHRLSRDDAGLVRASAPAVVLSVQVAPGDAIAEGDRLAVLEAMKSEIAVLAPCAGVVREVLVGPNQQVETGQPLVALEPETAEQQGEGGERIRLDALTTPPEPGEPPSLRCGLVLEGLRRLALGFDLEPGGAGRRTEAWRALCAELPPDHPELLRGEEEVLEAFADNWALFERRSVERGLIERELRTPEEYLLLYLRSLDPRAAGLSSGFVDRLRRALAHYGIDTLDRTPELEEALYWVARAHERHDELVGIVLAILERRLERHEAIRAHAGDAFRELLDRIVTGTAGHHPALSDLAREARYRLFDRPFFDAIRERAYAEAEEQLIAAANDGVPVSRRAEAMQSLVDCAQPLAPLWVGRFAHAAPPLRAAALEALTRRYYRIRRLERLSCTERGGRSFVTAEYDLDGRRLHVVSTHGAWKELPALWDELPAALGDVPPEHDMVLDLYLARGDAHPDPDASAAELLAQLAGRRFARPLRRIVVAIGAPGGGRGMGSMQHFTFRPDGAGYVEDRLVRGLHPMMGKRLHLWRLANFEIERIASAEDVYLFRGVARTNPRDERLFAFVEVRDLTPMRDALGRITHLPHLEMQYLEALAAIRRAQSRRDARHRLHWNRVTLYVWPPLRFELDELHEIAQRLALPAEGLGLQKTVVRARIPDKQSGELRDTVIQIGIPGGHEVVLTFAPPGEPPIAPLSAYAQRAVRMRERGLLYPYELLRLLTPPRDATRAGLPPGQFVEHDLDEAGRLVPVARPPGENRAGLVVGVIRNFTPKHPEGMARVILLGDPSRELGAFAEPECRRIIAALDLAASLAVPLEWFAVSAGAKIAMDSGTENLDWTAAALRRLIEFTEAGGEVNVVVAGINVGGQSYWNAEATMLMHCRGMLVMTPDGSMVLTGKRALDYSGGVSAEDHQGIGGYERIMGVNGEAQYWAPDIGEACRLLFRYYEHTYVGPGERFPRRAGTSDPPDRDVRDFPYRGDAAAFERVGDIWDDQRNPGRRKPFGIREVMRAAIDQDHEPLERWADMREAESAVVWDAHLGGIPACLIGIESEPLPRLGFVPADGPDSWTPGTLFPLSSKKVARAIRAASGNRPVVVLANLSGFDGSPESLRRLQLEYGAEIGRAVVDFRGPIVFCVIGRYHGGAYVVFSQRLNERLEAAALEGSYASVIGGAPAAAVVFSGEVDRRTRADSRLAALEAEITAADEATRGRLRARWHDLYETIHGEKLGEVAEEFDQVHSVHRAQRVGSLRTILPPARLRPWLIEALERGMRAGESA